MSPDWLVCVAAASQRVLRATACSPASLRGPNQRSSFYSGARMTNPRQLRSRARESINRVFMSSTAGGRTPSYEVTWIPVGYSCGSGGAELPFCVSCLAIEQCDAFEPALPLFPAHLFPSYLAVFRIRCVCSRWRIRRDEA